METENTKEELEATDSERVGVDDRRLVGLLRGCAYELWCASLCSGPKKIADLFKELSNPKVGDLVMEITTHGVNGFDPVEGIGTLVETGREPMFASREEARQAGWEDNEPIPSREVWDIRLDFDGGKIFRWENARFIKVKSEPNKKL